MQTLYCDGSVYRVWINGEKGWDAFFSVVLDDGTSNGKLLRHASIGNQTISIAEYSAVIWALCWSIKPVRVITDAHLIIGHVYQQWKCAEHLIPFRDTVVERIKKTDSELIWLPREKNMAGKFFERFQKNRQEN